MNEYNRIRVNVSSESAACFCIGPQNGEPLCPCRMRNVTKSNGRYIEEIDHGPVLDSSREDWVNYEDAIQQERDK